MDLTCICGSSASWIHDCMLLGGLMILGILDPFFSFRFSRSDFLHIRMVTSSEQLANLGSHSSSLCSLPAFDFDTSQATLQTVPSCPSNTPMQHQSPSSSTSRHNL